jgi:hypothetical protein
MGTLSFWEHYETFGGMPEPGETYPDDPDAARDERDDLREQCDGSCLEDACICYRRYETEDQG